MAERGNLDELFEAALHQKEPPTRFGTPLELRKRGPVEQVGSQPNPFEAGIPPQGTGEVRDKQIDQLATPANSFAAAKSIGPVEPIPTLDGQAALSLDNTINAELAAILDEKVAKEKRSKRRSFIVTMLVVFGLTGGGSAWFVSDPQRMEAFSQTMKEIKSAGDIKGMIATYQKALDKIAVRGQQIDSATTAMGVDPASVSDDEDPGFDKEMREMMGEDGGPTTGARDALLRERFQSVEEGGTLMPAEE